MTRKRIFGVLGLAATLSLPATVAAQAAATIDISAPQSPDTTGTGVTAKDDATVTPYYGTNKLHFGVKLADGTYDTAHPPALAGATFQIVETGSAVAGGELKTTCTMDLGADPGDATNPFPGEAGYHYFCDLHPNDPSYPNGYYTYFVQGADRVHVHQLTAPSGVQKDPLTREPTQCVFPGDATGGTCSTFGWHLDFIDTGLKPVAANFSQVVNHGHAQTIDAIAKSQTAGAPASLTITKKPAHGTAVIKSNKIVYTPSGTYGGLDAFTYTLKTAHGSSVGTVHMSIQVPPLARADTARAKGNATRTGQPVSVAVLSNDLARGGGALHGLAVSVRPKHGTARVAGSKIVYTPAKGFHGTDAVTYLVKNKYGSATARLTITVAKP